MRGVSRHFEGEAGDSWGLRTEEQGAFIFHSLGTIDTEPTARNLLTAEKSFFFFKLVQSIKRKF